MKVESIAARSVSVYFFVNSKKNYLENNDNQIVILITAKRTK